MTINFIFFTITISKRVISLKEAIHNENVEKIYEKHREIAANHIRPY
ncbi:YrzI family protein [Oceanobacillus arenosus]|uniref:YrzI family protein n=1 Tax=Oceanobacillus arenosus TaxID=1229153 RepID=A0A3D8PQT5_9BACI|nr:YrzI family small protein [Oceanobacillus arenosus]RDW17539.1 YrzI family protein [Oceanobacillus arenosus]